MAGLSPHSTIVDFEEKILLPTVRATLRIWEEGSQIVGFSFVDDYNNLWYDTQPEFLSLDELESEIIDWGVACQRKRNAETSEPNNLDCSCSTENIHRIQVLEKHGFRRERVRSLGYSRSLTEPVQRNPLPEGFSIRCVTGEDEVENLVALHRAAFGTDSMTIEERLAMMHNPQYVREMDLLVVAPDGGLAAFCVCGFDPENKIGYTDPIGTHPRYRRMGLGKAVVLAGFATLHKAGATVGELGTSSENHAMQRLASELGFVCVSEKLWFSKIV